MATGDDTLERDALAYHSAGPRPGKLEIRATKPMDTQMDLSLAYSPGVAAPCRVIAEDSERVFDYTARGNLVAVVSNGTAVLGLGAIGPYAAKPVMEGKAVLFKRFADIDVFDIEIDAREPEDVIRVVKALEPTFGGINLEDIRAPDSFVIEETLKREMDIPVFHDDQHGTAIISGAALLNALEIAGKEIGAIKVVVSGAGAAAIACSKLWIALGVDPDKIFMADRKGILTTRRDDLDEYKSEFARDTSDETLGDAMRGADVFMGLSVGGVVSQDMVREMADKPIVFALANPDPEIAYPDVMEVRPDAIMATGRTDFPNQVNNVLGFPFIFRGALDVRARAVNEPMKIAAAKAIAALAREPVPASVSRAYEDQVFQFGPEYIIPKPFDPRVLVWVAPAVARAAVESGVARTEIKDWDAYRLKLEQMMDPGRGLVRLIHERARRDAKRIVFAEGDEDRVIKAASVLAREGLVKPTLLGIRSNIEEQAEAMGVSLDGVDIFYPRDHPRFDAFVSEFLEVNQRRGMTNMRSRHEMMSRTPFSLMMVRRGEADGVVLGATRPYADAMRPALRIVGSSGAACGVYVVLTRQETLFFADTTAHIDPDAEALAAIALNTVQLVRSFGITPRVAMLSFANFGAVRHPEPEKVERATELVREREPALMIDGELQVDTALDMEFRKRTFPWSRLTERANVFVFPNLASANIAYKMLHQLGAASVFGPLLLGMKKPVTILPLNADATDIVNLAAWTALTAQETKLDGFGG